MTVEPHPNVPFGSPEAPLAVRTALRLLVVEDAPDDFELLVQTLSRQGMLCQATRVETAATMHEQLSGQTWDAIICDHHLPSFSSNEAFTILRASGLDLPFIIVSGTIGEEAAVAAMRLGADDYLIKGRLARLAPALRNAIAAAATRAGHRTAEAALARSQQELQALSLHLLEAIEAERADIAREIHDEIGSGLTALQFDLAWIARHGDAKAAERAAAARAQVADLMQAGQRLIRNLRPPVLDAGLIAALEWQVRQFRERTGLTVRLQRLGSDAGIGPEHALVCYRTLQEALTNITRHAGASSVDVSLVIGEADVSLEINDNGVGISPQSLTKPASFGLRGLAERLGHHGGWIEANRGLQGGTTVLMSLPLADDGARTDGAQPS